MTQPEVDWQLESIPSADAPPLVTPPRQGRARRWWLLLLVLALAALGLGAYLGTGWGQLRDQLQQEVDYEDTQSRAGQVELVLAVHHPDDALWRQQRAAEVSECLPARLPSPDLMPLDQPGRVIQLRPVAGDTYEIFVRRTLADPIGRTFAFDLWQRYRRLGPGLWERLPPADTDSAVAKRWSGQRLTAAVPAVDWATLEPLLPAIDATLQRACATWGCPSELVVPLTFTAQLSELMVITPTVRAPDDGLGPYPLTFDVVLNADRPKGGLTLPSPRLTGLPVGQAAAQAYARALQARVLVFLANAVNSPSSRTVDLFRDALVAREEIRQGLAAAPLQPLSPADYRSPESLWNTTRQVASTTAATEVAHRLLALRFLDDVLAGQPRAADGHLLRTLRSGRELVAWLATLPGSDVGAAAGKLNGWREATQAEFERDLPANLSELGGLAYACRDGTWLVRGGQSAQVLPSRATVLLNAAALAPGGDVLALGDQVNPTSSEIHLVDLTTLEARTVAVGAGVWVLGWSAAGEVIFLQQSPQSGNPLFTLALWRLPPDGEPQPILPDVRFSAPTGQQLWSSGREQLALTVEITGGVRLFTQSPALLSPNAGGRVQTVLSAAAGTAVAYSPDGTLVAFVQDHLKDDFSYTHGTIELYAVSGGTLRTLISTETMDLPPDTLAYLSTLVWSPDSRRLAFVSNLSPGGQRLRLVGVPDGAGTRSPATTAGSLRPAFRPTAAS